MKKAKIISCTKNMNLPAPRDPNLRKGYIDLGPTFNAMREKQREIKAQAVLMNALAWNASGLLGSYLWC